MTLMISKYAKYAFIIGTILLFNCIGGDDSGSGEDGSVTLKIQGTIPGSLQSAFGSKAVSNASVVVTDNSGTQIGTIVLTDARLALKEIEFEKSSSIDDDEVEFEGPYVVDLLNNTVTPSLEEITIDPGIYTEIELKLDKIEGDETDEDGITPLVDSSDSLYENSIVLEGTYTGTTADGPVTNEAFSLTYNFDEEFELTGSSDTSLGFTIEDDEQNPIIIAFRIAKWFNFNDSETNSDNVDFSLLTLSAGEIVLDENSSGNNHKIREVIEKNIKESADYGEDSDGSGVLETDEDDDPDEEDDDDS